MKTVKNTNSCSRDVLQDMEMRISGLEDSAEERDTAVRESVRSKNTPGTNQPGNLGHYGKTKSTINICRGRRSLGQ